MNPLPFLSQLRRLLTPRPTMPVRRKQHRAKPAARGIRGLERLESRDTPTGTFTSLTFTPPTGMNGVGMMEQGLRIKSRPDFVSAVRMGKKAMFFGQSRGRS